MLQKVTSNTKTSLVASVQNNSLRQRRASQIKSFAASSSKINYTNPRICRPRKPAWRVSYALFFASRTLSVRIAFPYLYRMSRDELYVFDPLYPEIFLKHGSSPSSSLDSGALWSPLFGIISSLSFLRSRRALETLFGVVVWLPLFQCILGW